MIPRQWTLMTLVILRIVNRHFLLPYKEPYLGKQIYVTLHCVVLMKSVPSLPFSLLSTAVMLEKCTMGSSTSRCRFLRGSPRPSAVCWWVFCRKTSTDASGPSQTLWVCYVSDKGCFSNDDSIKCCCNWGLGLIFIWETSPKLYKTSFWLFMKTDLHRVPLTEFKIIFLLDCQCCKMSVYSNTRVSFFYL